MTVSRTVFDISFQRNQAKFKASCEKNISRGNKRKAVYTSSSIFNGGELWIARYLLCSLRKSSTKFGGKFLKKKREEETLWLLFAKKNGYRSTRGDSSKFSLHFYNMRKNFKIRETWWWRMINNHDENIEIVVVGGVISSCRILN